MTISIGNMLASIKLTQWFLKNKKSKLVFGGKDFIPVTLDNISSEDSEKLNKFCKALKIDPQQVDNFGLASFKKMAFLRHCPAYFCLNEDGEMGLMIGSSQDESENGEGLKTYFVPCIVENNEYSLNGVKLKLKEAKNLDGTSKGSAYIEFDAGRDTYSIPFLINDDYKGSELIDSVFDKWDQGAFNLVLRQYGTGGNRNYSKFNKLFVPAFDKNYFPEDGVILVLKNGTYTNKEWEDKKGKKSRIIASDWEIVGSSHPDLLVQIVKKDKTTELETTEILPLEAIQNVSFTTAAQPTQWMIETGFENYKDKVTLLWVIGINSKTLDSGHTPEHAFVTDSFDFNELPVSEYPHLSKFFLLPSYNARADLQSDYPALPSTTANTSKGASKSNPKTSPKVSPKKSEISPEDLKVMSDF